MRQEIELKIGELVLEGLSPVDRERIGPAMERELSRLLFLSGGRKWMGDLSRLSLGDLSVEVPHASKPEQIGTHIAREIFSRIDVPRVPQPVPGKRGER